MRSTSLHSLNYLIFQQFELYVCKLCIIIFVLFSSGLHEVCHSTIHQDEIVQNYLVTMVWNDSDSLYINENCHNKFKFDCDV